MPTLLLRIRAVMQSWGTRSRFDDRDSDQEPSKSGMVGLLCAALGIPREDTERTLQLAACRMGVRVDAKGLRKTDYHTAQMNAKSATALTLRHFLCDAAFLVGFESDDLALLGQAHAALLNPAYPLFFGRKSFVPSHPIYLPDGLQSTSLEVALHAYPSLVKSVRNDHPEDTKKPLILILESKHNSGSLRFDQPISGFAERRFGARFVETHPWEEVTHAPE